MKQYEAKALLLLLLLYNNNQRLAFKLHFSNHLFLIYFWSEHPTNEILFAYLMQLGIYVAFV